MDKIFCPTKFSYMHEPTNSNTKNSCYDSSEISSEDSSDEELNTHIGNTIDIRKEKDSQRF